MSNVVNFAKDLAERAGWTFVQAAAASAAVGQVTSLNEVKQAALSAAVAGGAAVLSLVKGVIAGTKTGTASSLKNQAVGEAEVAGKHVLDEALAEANKIYPMPQS